MWWEPIRETGFMMFVCGSFVLFAVTLGQYLDPPQPHERIRSISELVDVVCWRRADASRCLLGNIGDVSRISDVDMSRSA